MYGRGDKRDQQSRSGARPHEEFLELCAVSTSGELSEEEQQKLQEHLATCPECQQALQEFEATADIGVPFLSSALSASGSSEPGLVSEEVVELPGPGSQTRGEGPRSSADPEEQSKRLILAERNGQRSPTNWNYVWLSLAAALLLVSALGIYSFQFGKQRGREVVQMTPGPSAADSRMEALEQQMSDAGHEREVLKTELVQRDEIIADLRKQVADQSSILAEVKSTEANLKDSLESKQAETQQVAEEKSSLSAKVEAAETSLQKKQAELDSLRQQRSQDESRSAGLEAQIRDLSGLLRDREQELNKQEELLAHDRDIRDLMGARDLYIAEVYDVGRDGATQKPYGRVFYTKGKSLVFYAYDLDQQPGVKSASTFQAWGRGGADRQEVLNLGIFYHDNAAKKRWVLKFDDPRTLEQLDAVFVTVEPAGGSHKPSTKPLLFASLRIQANHP